MKDHFVSSCVIPCNDAKLYTPVINSHGLSNCTTIALLLYYLHVKKSVKIALTQDIFLQHIIRIKYA